MTSSAVSLSKPSIRAMRLEYRKRRRRRVQCSSPPMHESAASATQSSSSARLAPRPSMHVMLYGRAHHK